MASDKAKSTVAKARRSGVRAFMSCLQRLRQPKASVMERSFATTARRRSSSFRLQASGRRTVPLDVEVETWGQEGGPSGGAGEIKEEIEAAAQKLPVAALDGAGEAEISGVYEEQRVHARASPKPESGSTYQTGSWSGSPAVEPILSGTTSPPPPPSGQPLTVNEETATVELDEITEENASPLPPPEAALSIIPSSSPLGAPRQSLSSFSPPSSLVQKLLVWTNKETGLPFRYLLVVSMGMTMILLALVGMWAFMLVFMAVTATAVVVVPVVVFLITSLAIVAIIAIAIVSVWAGTLWAVGMGACSGVGLTKRLFNMTFSALVAVISAVKFGHKKPQVIAIS